MMNKRALNPLINSHDGNKDKNPNSFCKVMEKQTAPQESAAQELSVEWSHFRISSTDSKLRTT